MLAFMMLAPAQYAISDGFIEDGKSSVLMRNLYNNQDTRNQDSPSAKEWGQGFILNYQSGFTEGLVGFGLDVQGLYALRLDSGGDANKSDISRKPGSSFPLDDGHAPDGFGRVGVTGKIRLSKTVAQIGSLQPKLPILVYNDGRVLPQTFNGFQVTSNELDRLTFIGGRLDSVKERNSSGSDAMAINSNAKQTSNDFSYAGVDFQASKDLKLQYYHAKLEDFYQQNFLGLTHLMELRVGSLTTDLRYFRSSSDGSNSSAAGRADGYVSSGYYGDGITTGEVDSKLWSGMLTYSLKGHAIGAGYQEASGDSDFPHLNTGNGQSLYLITNAQLNKFASAGEKTWVASYAYDCKEIGVNGLKFKAAYFSGDNIRAQGGDHKEFERNLRIDYIQPTGPLKGVGVTWMNSMFRGNDTADKDENRLIFSYTLPIF